MVTLRRIGVRSAGRVGFWLGVALSMMQILILFIALLFIFRLPPEQLFASRFLVRVVFGVLLAGVNTAMTAALFAFAYNVASGPSGGLQLDFEMPDTPTQKRKNDDTQDAE